MSLEWLSKHSVLVGSDTLSGAGDCMVYAVQTSTNEIVLIDSGVGRKKHIEKIISNCKQAFPLMNSINTLILTHCHIDHIGGAYFLLQKFPKMKIAAHKADVAAIKGDLAYKKRVAADWYGIGYNPVIPSIVFENDKEKIIKIGRISFHVIHIPGHTPGSIAIWFDDGNKRVLLGQDIHGPFLPEFGSDIDAWRESMQKLIAIDADILGEGHFGIFRGKQKVASFINKYLLSK